MYFPPNGDLKDARLTIRFRSISMLLEVDRFRGIYEVGAETVVTNSKVAEGSLHGDKRSRRVLLGWGLSGGG